MQVLKYRYRIYPTPVQTTKLKQFCGANRFIWNTYLAKEIEQYQENQTFSGAYKNAVDVTGLRKTLEWLKETPSASLQQTLINLDRAIKQSYKNAKAKKGFPKFKKRRNFDASFSLAMVNSGNFKENKFLIPKIGLVSVVKHRDLPSDFASCQIKQEANKWYVCITCKKEKKPKRPTALAVGVDLNSKNYVLSDGSVFTNPKFLAESQGKIKRLQRQLARKQKGSKNRNKCQLKLRKVNQSVVNKRLDYFHKLSKTLVDSYDLICLEDLDVKQIQKKYGKVVQDNGFSMLRQFCLYKSELYGSTTVIINRYYPSSQTCSECNSIQKMPLHVRNYNCVNCGMSLDRDLNAAINICRAGTAQSAFGDDQLTNHMICAKLTGINEEGSLFL